MDYPAAEVESIIRSALDAHNRTHTKDLEHRMTTLENSLLEHMKWEERNGDMMRESMERQAKLIEKLFTKFDDATRHTDNCRLTLESKIADEYVRKSDFELILEKRNRYNVEHAELVSKQVTECANGLRLRIDANEKKIERYAIIVTTVGAVLVFGGKFAEWIKSMGITP